MNGCTLRARSLDYYAAALGIPPERLVEALFGARVHEAETRAQRFGVVTESAPGRFELPRLHLWMGPDEGADGGDVLAYGLRNGHLVARLAEHVAALGVPFTGEAPGSFAACVAQAPGERPLVVNATHEPVSDLPRPAPPTRFVAASQLTLRRRAGSALPAGSSFLALRRREGCCDAGVFYPFVDALTPGADFYGIFYRIVRPGPGFAKEAALAPLRRTVIGVADALGLDPVDAEATRGEALVPCLPWSDVPTSRPDWLDLHRTYSACTPIITGDGMTRAGLAGWVAAEAILAGEDPVPVTNRSLLIWRRTNRGFASAMTWLSPWVVPMLRRRPGAILRRAVGPDDMWGRVAGGDAGAAA